MLGENGTKKTLRSHWWKLQQEILSKNRSKVRNVTEDILCNRVKRMSEAGNLKGVGRPITIEKDAVN